MASTEQNGGPTAPQEPPGLPVRAASALILLLIGLITTGETDRLITGALTDAGESRSVANLVGVSAWDRTGTWNTWLFLSDDLRHSVAVWVVLYAAFDLVFVVGYLLLLRPLVAPVPVARRALTALVAIEVLETALLIVNGILLFAGGVPAFFRWAVAVASVARWLAVAVLAVAAIADRGLRVRVGAGVLRALRAGWEQRLLLIVVAVVGALSLVPLPDIWDQLPDVQRSWVDGDLSDVLHPIWAIIATAVVAGYLFTIGRQRSERVWSTRVSSRTSGGPAPRPSLPPRWWMWWLTPSVAVVGVALILTALPVDDIVDWRIVGIVAAVPVGIVLLSVVAALFDPAPPADDNDPASGRILAHDVWRAGDVLALAIVVSAGLGLVRSLTAPVLLGPQDQHGGTWLFRLVVLVLGTALAAAAFPLARAGLARLDDPERSGTGRGHAILRFFRPSDDSGPGDRVRNAAFVALSLIAVAVIVALMVWPVQISRNLGVVATTLLALGTWVLVLGTLTVHLHRFRPPPIMTAIRMRNAPVLTLLVAIPLVVSQAGGDPDLHAVSGPPGGPPGALPARPSLSVAFDAWLARSGACDRTVGDQTVRPMVLVAASGGGIRAAMWTAGVMQRLRDAGDCGRTAVFLSSGVSGGSVGLVLARGDDPLGDAERLSRPDALAAALTGTIVGDLLAGGSGLRIPSLSAPGSTVDTDPAGRDRWRWRDRAALMEAVWEAQAPTLTTRFDATVRGPGGALVMNSTAAGRGCRVFISQIALGDSDSRSDGDDTTTDTDPARCQGQTDDPPASVDLQDAYGECMPDMSWATAAMLSARFPTITPGGRVPPAHRVRADGATEDCGPRPDLQLVDGGYAESSGIGTLADVTPALQQIVRNHNTARTGGQPLVVPVVLYLEDETRRDIVYKPPPLAAEVLVPRAGVKARDIQTSSGTWLQRVAGIIADPCPPPNTRQPCLDAVAAIRGSLTGGVVIAAPLTKPAVEAPLGWTLSEDSRNRLIEAVNECPDARPGGYACLDDLITVLDR